LLFLIEATATGDPEAETSDVLRLPIYESEKDAGANLRSRLEKLGKKSDVSIESSKEVKLLTVGDFLCARREIHVVGQSPDLLRFVVRLDDPLQFSFLADLELKPNQRDTGVLEARAIIHSWYAKDEQGSRKALEWAEKTNHPGFASHVLFKLVELLPEKDARMKCFAFKSGRVELSGESKNAKVAEKYGTQVFDSMPLDYSWSWLEEPAKSKETEDVFEFTILGTRLGKASPPAGPKPQKRKLESEKK